MMASASNTLREPTERESHAGDKLESDPASYEHDNKHTRGLSLTSSDTKDANTWVKLESIDDR
jgi:hypothetical protein